jgi:hypothetical protein
MSFLNHFLYKNAKPSTSTSVNSDVILETPTCSRNKRTRASISSDTSPIDVDLKRKDSKISPENISHLTVHSESTGASVVSVIQMSESEEEMAHQDESEETMEGMIDRLLRQSERRQNKRWKEEISLIADQFESLRQELQPVFAAVDKLPRIEQGLNSASVQIAQISRTERRNNIIVHGVPEKTDETFRDRDAEIERISKLLKLNKMDYSEAIRLGKKLQDKSRPLLIKLMRFREKAEIQSKSSLLKGSGISISDDLSPDERKVRGLLNAKRKAIMNDDKKAQCKIRNGAMTAQTKGQTEVYKVNTSTWTLEKMTQKTSRTGI